MDGLAPVLRCLLAMGAIPWSEKLGVRPRPMRLNGVLLLRLFSKHMGDGASFDLGDAVALPQSWCFRQRQWRKMKATAMDGRHKSFPELRCNFLFL